MGIHIHALESQIIGNSLSYKMCIDKMKSNFLVYFSSLIDQ